MIYCCVFWELTSQVRLKALKAGQKVSRFTQDHSTSQKYNTAKNDFLLNILVWFSSTNILTLLNQDTFNWLAKLHKKRSLIFWRKKKVAA